MDLIGQMKMADFYLKLYRGELKRLANYEYVPQKAEYHPEDGESVPLPHATPESQGMSSEHLAAFLQEMDGCRDTNPHGVMVLRHGKVLCEAYWKPYRGDYPHMLFSLSKTFVGTAVGMAVAEGILSLDDRLVDIFPEKVLPLRGSRLNALTVRHALTMQTGVRFNEVGSVLERDWAKGFLQSEIAFEPGTQFSYNSMNTYLLSAAVCRRAGMGLVEYLTPRLFEPLGIRNVTWEKCPLGLEKGGWGLSLRLGDIAKLGQLYLQKGVWTVDGKPRRLLTEQWVDEATHPQVAPCEGAPDGYGYQIWMCPVEGAYNFNGIFGQYVVVFPQQDVVVAVLGGSQNLMPEGSTLDLVCRYFGGGDVYSETPLPKNLRGLRRLVRTMQGLVLLGGEVRPHIRENHRTRFRLWPFTMRRGAPKQEEKAQRSHDGETYALKKSFGALLPFVIQGVHANFTGGLERIGLSFSPGQCTVTLTEGENVNTVAAGLDGEPRYSTVTVNGEVFRVGGMARWTTDEDDRDVLKLYLSFIETPDTRILKLIFQEDGTLLIRFDERPSVRMALQLMDGVLRVKPGGGDYVKHRMQKLIAPEAVGERIRKPEA
jgi:CubicO group peptidase (beta-lactamase class C family)